MTGPTSPFIPATWCILPYEETDEELVLIQLSRAPGNQVPPVPGNMLDALLVDRSTGRGFASFHRHRGAGVFLEDAAKSMPTWHQLRIGRDSTPLPVYSLSWWYDQHPYLALLQVRLPNKKRVTAAVLSVDQQGDQSLSISSLLDDSSPLQYIFTTSHSVSHTSRAVELLKERARLLTSSSPSLPNRTDNSPIDQQALQRAKLALSLLPD